MFFILFFLTLSSFLFSESKGDTVSCRVFDQILLTHQVVPTGPIPTVLDPNGVYPYVSYCETSFRPVPESYKMIVLENEEVRVVICPDLGGKVMEITHKSSGRQVLYQPGIIKQTRILPRFYFVAGGIEVSFPISHTPTQNDPVCFNIDREDDRVYVTCGERELHYGLQWSVEYSLGKGDNFLTQRTVYYNPGKKSYPWMSWSNAALPSAPDTQYDFPQGRVLVHASKLDTIFWNRNEVHLENDIKEMTGFFWETKDVNAFGAFTPSLGIGLYHIANSSLTPGIKLWSYGVDKDKEWAMLSTFRRQPYIEIQGGPINDQSIKLNLAPNEKRWHEEYWFPTDRDLDITKLKIPHISLRPIKDIPLFDWNNKRNVSTWIKLCNAFSQQGSIPEAPQPYLMNWAPSGMENLDQPFIWAINGSNGDEQSYWLFHYGSWLAGSERVIEAISVLEKSNVDESKVLLSRLYAYKGNWVKAREVLEQISENSWLLLHPQVFVERDNILRHCGPSTLKEREKWFLKVDASSDESLLECKVRWLMDCGLLSEARQLLLSVNFQKIHQTYNRTELYKEINRKLGLPTDSIPNSLGEDRLARFGAYREYD